MTNQEQINLWKREYGRIFSISVRGVDYVFRAITFAEYDEAAAVEDTVDAEDFLVSIALLSPPADSVEFNRIPAGVITTIAEEVLEVSGFGAPRIAVDILEQHREQVLEVRGLMKAFIIAMMPAYRDDELDNFTFDQLAAKVALAEQIMKVHQASVGVDHEVKLDLIDPEEEAARQAAEVAKHNAKKPPGQAGLDDPIARKLQEALGG